MRKLDVDFYSRHTLDVAKDILGKVIVHNSPLGLVSERLWRLKHIEVLKIRHAMHLGGRKKLAKHFGDLRGMFMYI